MDFYKPELWPKFEDLFLNHYCPKFWSIDNVSLPYGNVMVIDPKDMPSMLWACDLNKVDNYEAILNELKTIQEKHNIPIGFSFSSSWQGDIDTFKKHIRYIGYQERIKFIWLAKNIVNYNQDKQSLATIERCHDKNLMIELIEMGFGKGTAEIFANGVLTNSEEDNRAFFIAKMDDGNVAGCGATYFHGKAGYMSCLAVKPEFRQQNIAKDLVKARIDFLRSNNVGHIINAVKESNTESLAVQSRSGYLPCAITEYWMPSSS